MLPSLTLSPYEPYRQRLELLSDDAALVPIIRLVGQERGWWDERADWQRSYGRFFPGEAPYATLVFAADATAANAQALCVVELYPEEPALEQAQQALTHAQPLGWLRLTRFPADQRLPTLAAVLAEPGQPKVMRYRPNKRCTLRFDYATGEPSVYAKVFPNEDGRSLYAEGLELWQAACDGIVNPAVTRPLRWDEATHTLWQSQVPGRPALKQLFGAGGPALAARMGRATASLAVAPLHPHSTFGRAEQMQDTIKQGTELCRRVPWLTGAVQRLWAELERLHAAAPARPLVPIHGAPHPHQWLDDGMRLGLVDFDGFTLGDPELDIATFLSEVDFEKPHKMACAAVNHAFLAGYEAVAGAVDQRLLAAYCAHKRLSKALKYAYALRSDADIRAEQALGRALMCVL